MPRNVKIFYSENIQFYEKKFNGLKDELRVISRAASNNLKFPRRSIGGQAIVWDHWSDGCNATYKIS